MNKLILFGAGASYGSKNYKVPPLGDDLFKALQNFNPSGWGELPSSVANEFKGDFENGMTNLSKTHSHDMPVLQRAMAGFFFNFMASENNLYHILAKRIKANNWRGAIASLNYERLLEQSLTHEGLQVMVGSETNIDGQIELCLPHGCCHLFCEGVSISTKGISFSGVGISFGGKMKVISNPNEYSHKINNEAIPPVMSYFEPQKSTSSGVHFIKEQRARWNSLVQNSDIIAIVGIRVRERDSHIWEPLKNASGKIIYCSGKTGAQEFSEWHNNYRDGKDDKTLNGYFADQFDALCTKLDL